MAGEESAWKKMRRYQKQDVELLEELHERLTGWIRMPHPVSSHNNTCRNCGSDKLQLRGLARTLNGTYQRYQCQDCGTWGRFDKRTPVGNTRTIV
jgi:RNase P subunit RPR2